MRDKKQVGIYEWLKRVDALYASAIELRMAYKELLGKRPIKGSYADGILQRASLAIRRIEEVETSE
jgi:hypothetical protein